MTDDDSPPLEPGRIFAALDRNEVQYVLVGGLAAQAHGAARLTQDLDICPAWDARNLELLAGALRDLGARHKGVAPEFHVPPDGRLIAGMEVGAWRTVAGDIDVLNGIPRERTPRRMVRYEQLLSDSETLEIDGRRIPVASLDSIIRSKEIAGRPKDRDALVELYELRDRKRHVERGSEPPDLRFEL